MVELVQQLLDSHDPAIRYRTAVEVCGLDLHSSRAIDMQSEIRGSDRMNRILSIRDGDGRFPGVYSKFTGVHWALADLADNGYPSGDESLLPARDQVYDCWLAPEHVRERIVEKEAARYKSRAGVPVIDGRARRCASQEGNALFATITLGLADERADQLAANLCRWQWPDGGWNCDRRAEASTSSFHESLLPLLGLVSYVAWKHSLHTAGSEDSAIRAAEAAIDRTCEFLLERSLYKRKRDGSVISADFLKLRYPHYWRYDILIALKVMAVAGRIADPRCEDALSIIESKQLPDGGWRATGCHSRKADSPANGCSMVDWGTVSRGKILNEFVTVEALSVLKAAGRLSTGFSDLPGQLQ